METDRKCEPLETRHHPQRDEKRVVTTREFAERCRAGASVLSSLADKLGEGNAIERLHYDAHTASWATGLFLDIAADINASRVEPYDPARMAVK